MRTKQKRTKIFKPGQAVMYRPLNLPWSKELILTADAFETEYYMKD